MTRGHSHVAGGSSVSCVCKVCGRRFFRRGNDISSSLSFSTPGGVEREDPRRSRTWRDWIIVMTNHCDQHIPPMPAAVARDLEMESRRRSDENLRLSRVRKIEESHVEGEGTHTIEEWREMARWRGR